MDEALYLVDGSGFIFRAYHALPPLSTKAGVPSGAVYGFTTMLVKLETDYRPSHLALMGDSVDNVPGIPGVGPKTASTLIKHFGSLEAMLSRVDEIASVPGLRGAASVQAKVAAHVEQARLSRRLIALDDQVPLPLP